MLDLLSAKQVTQITSLSRTTIWRMSNEGKFPKPIPISKGRIAWRTEEVNEWIREPMAYREKLEELRLE